MEYTNSLSTLFNYKFHELLHGPCPILDTFRIENNSELDKFVSRKSVAHGYYIM